MSGTYSDDVRVRFAPSPTGLLHIGGLRTALYNYLYARRHGGRFVLRIEDTDRERFVEEAEQDILEALAWTGLAYDEGPGKVGPFAPYHQSQRRQAYEEQARRLVASGHAYYAFDTSEDLDRMRAQFAREGNPSPKYDGATRASMKNSLVLPAGDVQRRLDAGEPHVVRLNVPRGETIRFSDLIRGTVSFESDTLDDQVLVKSDGMPTYHLANVVDDHLMGITHVIRGEEWLSSTPKHVLLYRFLDWEMPQMAHLPLILSPAGGKLSKRDADELGLPVTVRQVREAGFEPEALLNFLAFLGWNPGTVQEMFSIDELVEAFSLERIGSSGVQLNVDKLKWYNEQYLRQWPAEEIARRARPYLQRTGFDVEDEYLVHVAELMRDRITFAKDLAESCRYFFEDPSAYEEAGVKKRWKEDSAGLLEGYVQALERADGVDAGVAEEMLRELAESAGVGAGRIIHPVRLAVSGVSYGPSLFHMMEVLGKDVCLRRMRRAIEELG